jgi:hypothetical protein
MGCGLNYLRTRLGYSPMAGTSENNNAVWGSIKAGIFLICWMSISFSRKNICYWLLLRGGIVQSVSCTVTISLSIVCQHLNCSHSWFIHQSSLVNISRHLVVNQEKLGEKLRWILPMKYFFHTSQGYLTYCKILLLGAYSITSPPKEVVLRTFMALKIHRLRPFWTREPWVQYQAR